MRKGFLCSLAALATSGGMALAQGNYPAYGPGPAAPSSGVLAGMPGGYGQPYSPIAGRASASDVVPVPMMVVPIPVTVVAPVPMLREERPKMLGWPPVPGSIPPPPGMTATMVPPTKAQSAATRMLPAESGVEKTDNGVLKTSAAQEGENKSPDVTVDVTTPPAPQTMTNPEPGTPVLADECVPELIAPYDHPLCDRVPVGYHYYASAAALIWHLPRDSSPPLISSLSSTGVARTISGDDVGEPIHVGGRGTLGFWTCPANELAFQVSGFFFPQRGQRIVDSDLVINREFVATPGNPPPPLQLTGPSAAGDLGSGSATVSILTRFWGLDTDVRVELYRGSWGHLDWLTGVRYIDLDEALDIDTVVTNPINGQLTTLDHFGTTNHFFGGQMGVEFETNWNNFSLNGYAKSSLGVNHERVTINGQNSDFSVPAPQVVQSGFLALSSNIGQFSQDRFCVASEAGLILGYRINDQIRLTAGYSILNLTSVVRPGDQIDETVNIRLRHLPGTAAPIPSDPLRPSFGFNTSDYLAQGINAGVEIRW